MDPTLVENMAGHRSKPMEWRSIQEAVLAERERCAKIAELVAEHVGGKFDSASAYYIAELIRKGK